MNKYSTNDVTGHGKGIVIPGTHDMIWHIIALLKGIVIQLMRRAG